MKILITAPSLDENENVSGISTLVRNIIKYDRNEFFHFEAGRKDGEATGEGWHSLRLVSRTPGASFEGVTFAAFTLTSK